MEDSLYDWLLTKKKSELILIASDAIEKLIESDDVRLRDNSVPYWEVNGEILGE